MVGFVNNVVGGDLKNKTTKQTPNELAGLIDRLTIKTIDTYLAYNLAVVY